MNPCECIFNHEMAMRRFLSFLRQSQDNCNDVECFDWVDSNLNSDGMAESNVMMYSMLWIVIGFLLYFFRPQSLRNNKSPFRGTNGNNDDDSGPSPMAPSAH